MLKERLDKRLDAYCEEKKIQGVLRVTVGGEIKYERAFGYADIEKRTPFTKDSHFILYSLSKPFCTIGLLKLVDKGLVSLDAHPSVYVPECRGFNPRVTLRHVLNHTSGVPDFFESKIFTETNTPERENTIREQLKILAKLPEMFEPGTQGFYANINFNLSALIIENVSGMTYHEYMAREVFEPLGMKNALVYYDGLTVENEVSGYELDEDGELVKIPVAHYLMLGGGDIYATVDDVYRLNIAIKNGLLLKEKTWSEALTPSPINTFGYGCFIVNWHGKKRINHNGGHKGFRTLHLQLPEDDFDIILLSNSGFGAARADIPEIIYEEFYGTKERDDIKTEMDRGFV